MERKIGAHQEKVLDHPAKRHSLTWGSNSGEFANRKLARVSLKVFLPGESPNAKPEHPAGIFKKKLLLRQNVTSVLGQHLENYSAHMAAQGSQSLIVLLSFCAFLLVVPL